VSRHVSILHRKPRTRRERMRSRLHSAQKGLSDRFARLHARRRTRAAQHRVQELFLHLGHEGQPEPAPRRGRPHMPHIRHHR